MDYDINFMAARYPEAASPRLAVRWIAMAHAPGYFTGATTLAVVRVTHSALWINEC
jgi:hypothetical protein